MFACGSRTQPSVQQPAKAVVYGADVPPRASAKRPLSSVPSGRYRALGFEGPDIDAEIIAMSADLWEKLGIREYLTLEINSLGNREERAAHRAALVEYLTRYEDKLDEDSKRRLKTNPLRVLDTKKSRFAGSSATLRRA